MADPLPLTEDHDSAASLARTVRRELIWLACALLLGLLIVPVLIDLAGARTLGAYAGGTLQDFFVHFYRGLGSGSPGFWMVALGPYVILLAARGLWALLRS
ncbi:MAG TPA: hypothetical protein VME21_00235 [Steroidobacteraceae bacterium]|nr:hypothetical protein [Steroidobacteraceae bacterium]